MPFVTVVLFCYNAEKYVDKAISSILNQTYKEFELLILEDASTDRTSAIIKTYKDSRIRLVSHMANKGIAYNRHLALELAVGDYIFWMDNDDISHPDRIEKQMACFQKDEKLVLCGTFAHEMDNEGSIGRSIELPISDDEIKAAMLFTFPFVSPSVGIRKSAVTQEVLFFLTQVEQADDYVLYSALMNKGTFKNIPECLYYYRQHNSADRITTDKKRGGDIIAGRHYAWRIILSHMQLTATNEILRLHDLLTYYRNLMQASDLLHSKDYFSWLAEIINWSKFQKKHVRIEVQKHVDFKVKMMIYTHVLPRRKKLQLLLETIHIITWRCIIAIFLRTVLQLKKSL